MPEKQRFVGELCRVCAPGEEEGGHGCPLQHACFCSFSSLLQLSPYTTSSCSANDTLPTKHHRPVNLPPLSNSGPCCCPQVVE